MVGFASPFGPSDGQNRDLILEAIRTWASQNLLPWSAAWDTFFNALIPQLTTYINAKAVAGYSWRLTSSIIATTGNSVAVFAVDPNRPLTINDLVSDASFPIRYGIVTSVIDDSHANVSYVGVLGNTGGVVVSIIAGKSVAIDNTDPARPIITSIKPLGVNVKDYGAIGDGVADDTTAITNALAAVYTLGGIVYMPSGVYKITSTINVPNQVIIQGSTRDSSVINIAHPTADGLHLANGSGVEAIKFISTIARTGGTNVTLLGNTSYVNNCNFSNYFVAVTAGIAGTACINPRITNSGFGSPAIGPGSGGIVLVYTAGAVIDNLQMLGPGTGTQPDFGLKVMQGDALNAVNCNITRHGRALYITPATGLVVTAHTFANCFFDSANGSASAVISPSGSGIYHTKFTNCWFGIAAQQGCVIDGTTYAVDGTSFSGCEFTTNTGEGLLITGTHAINTEITGGWSGGNTGNGISISNGASYFTITGHRVGPVAGGTGNATGILVAASASDNYVIVGNNLRGNTTSLTDSGTGINKVVANNLI